MEMLIYQSPNVSTKIDDFADRIQQISVDHKQKIAAFEGRGGGKIDSLHQLIICKNFWDGFWWTVKKFGEKDKEGIWWTNYLWSSR